MHCRFSLTLEPDDPLPFRAHLVERPAPTPLPFLARFPARLTHSTCNLIYMPHSVSRRAVGKEDNARQNRNCCRLPPRPTRHLPPLSRAAHGRNTITPSAAAAVSVLRSKPQAGGEGTARRRSAGAGAMTANATSLGRSFTAIEVDATSSGRPWNGQADGGILEPGRDGFRGG